jgi:hypothetical protein
MTPAINFSLVTTTLAIIYRRGNKDTEMAQAVEQLQHYQLAFI